MSSWEYHPFDFASLSKGTWIETDELERAAGCKRHHPRWGLKLMQLCTQITGETGILCRRDHDRLRLMDDAEADDYTMRRTAAAVDSLRRQRVRRMLIDATGFDTDSMRRFEARSRIVDATAEAASHALRRSKRTFLPSGEPAALPASTTDAD